jgi:hypothetical protein
MRIYLRILELICPLFLCSVIVLSEDFKWEQVPAWDWNVVIDSSKGIRDAVMIFEKVVQNDRDMSSNNYYFSVYRRIRIFTPEGKSWGDVDIPVMDENQKIDELRGRTILPDGKEIELDENRVHEKEVFRSDGLKVKQKSFSLPGIVEGCIIEYYFKLKLSGPASTWYIQKGIPVLRGEMVWELRHQSGFFSQLLNPTESIYNKITQKYVPNFLWLNLKNPGTADNVMHENDLDAIRFAINNVPPYKEEPYSRFESGLIGQLKYYYGSPNDPTSYWRERSVKEMEGLKDFLNDNDRLKPVLESFPTSASQEEKITLAYDWITKHIKNISYYESAKKHDKNDNVNDVLQHGYANISQIDLVFYAMLKQMDINARIVFAMNRREGEFHKDAKYWQFEGPVIIVPGAGDSMRCYCPGLANQPPGVVPWYYEGSQGFVLGDSVNMFVTLPSIRPDYHREIETFTLRLNDDNLLQGTFADQMNGSGARTLRMGAIEASSKEQTDEARKALEREFPKAEIDSISLKGIDNLALPAEVDCSLKLPTPEQRIGTTIMIKPFADVEVMGNPFRASTREHIIDFGHAKNYTQVMKITLPAGCHVDGLPSDTAYSNEAGSARISFAAAQGVVTIQRNYVVTSIYFPPSSYEQIRKIFQLWESFRMTTIVAKQG